MEQITTTEIRDKLQKELFNCTNAHEASAWAKALKDLIIAVGIQKNIKKTSVNT